ncbi:response regulator [Rhizobium sp. 3T7]|uniref:response regulator n=1 Tax=Rhizobium sp. 3T7 TaxID=2874922 RepID=UPI001CCA8959|nr:response regulator [Rhizobium sp. 3T7]MBZ9793133.1 response regulator [Rhizobium sp. 3T7]
MGRGKVAARDRKRRSRSLADGITRRNAKGTRRGSSDLILYHSVGASSCAYVLLHRSIRALVRCPSKDIDMPQVALQSKTLPTVLVVEASAELRAAMRRAIEMAGLAAVDAAGGEEALRILDRRSDIDLVFTAINMPGSVDGVNLAVRIHRQWPELAIVITSAVVSLRQSSLPERCRFLKKPYNSAEAIKCFRFLLGC